jgi:hypothetical protein
MRTPQGRGSSPGALEKSCQLLVEGGWLLREMSVRIYQEFLENQVSNDPAFQRTQLIGQLRLLLLRAERGLPVGFDSVLRVAALVRCFEGRRLERA